VYAVGPAGLKVIWEPFQINTHDSWLVGIKKVTDSVIEEDRFQIQFDQVKIIFGFLIFIVVIALQVKCLM